MKKTKPIRLFLLLVLIIWIMRFVGTIIINKISEWSEIYIPSNISDYFLNILLFEIFAVMLFLIVWGLKCYEKNTFWNDMWLKICKYKCPILLIFAGAGCFIEYIPQIFILLFPIICFFIIKNLFSDSPLMQEYFLRFNSVKKYFLVFLILEMLMLLAIAILCNFIDLNFLFFLAFVYIHISCLLWYFPFFVLSYIYRNK